MSEYRVEVKIKNNLLYRKIFANYTSVADFCKRNSISQGVVGQLLRMKEAPILPNGEWRQVVYSISSALHCEPEDLFTHRQRTLIAKRSHVLELTEDGLAGAIDAGPQKLIEERSFIKAASTTLTPREQRVIDLYYKDNLTFDEIGALLTENRQEGVCGWVAQQIHAKALRKLQSQARKIQGEATEEDYMRK